MSVKLIENFKSYSVHKDGEWATICIRQTKNDYLENSYNGGEILIHSSYGSWGYSWGNIGSRDFREFLSKLDYHYFWGKLDEELGECFDDDGTIREIKRIILRDRRNGDIVAEEAREHFDEILSFEEFQDSHKDSNAFYSTMNDCYRDLFSYLNNGDLVSITKKKQECDWFWKTLWSEFIEEMKKELQNA
jgi:hypothetical protein